MKRFPILRFLTFPFFAVAFAAAVFAAEPQIPVRNVIGAVGDTTTVNGHPLSGNIVLTATDTGAATALTRTSVKTGNYTAAAGDLIPVDVATTGNVTITLPTAPAANARVLVKLVSAFRGRACTVVTGGSDKLNTATGGTSATLTLANQAIELQYASGIWTVVGDDLPLGQLDSRYLPSATNAWSINLSGQIAYFDGASIMRGYGLGTSQLANGGLTGNFGDVFSRSAWFSGKGAYYNDGVDGCTSAQLAARYTTGQSTYGVTVPSAHSLAPAVTGSSARAIYFLFGDVLNNDHFASVSASSSISTLAALATTIRSEGYFLVLITCPVGTNFASIATANKMMREGSVPCDLLVDAAPWLPDNTDTTLYQGDGTHFTTAGHKAAAANLVAAIFAGASSTNYGINYHPAAETFAGGATFSGGATFPISPTFTSNVILGTVTPSGTTTPMTLSLGGTYGTNAAGRNFKVVLFDDGNVAENGGLGAALGVTEFTAAASGNIAFYSNHSPSPIWLGTLSPSSLALPGNLTLPGNIALGNFTPTGTAAPLNIDLGGTYGNNTAGKNLKITVFDDGNSNDAGGIGVAAGNLEITAQAAGNIVLYSARATPDFLGRITATSATFNGTISPSNTTITWSAGSGSPEGVVTAPVGSLYSRTNGGTGTTLYVKESGAGNTGWAAK